MILYSNEPTWDGLYENTFNVSNGTKIRLANINRSNNKNKIYVEMNLQGKCYINIYRGYFEDELLKYELSNHVLVDGNGDDTYYFQDFTNLNRNYTNYYVEIEALESISFVPYQTGLIFDEIEGVVEFSSRVGTSLQNDINGYPLEQQKFDKLVNFGLLVNRGYMNQLVNVVEKPFYLVMEFGCVINNSTKLLANRSITPEYVSTHTQMMNMKLTNIEQI